MRGGIKARLGLTLDPIAPAPDSVAPHAGVRQRLGLASASTSSSSSLPPELRRGSGVKRRLEATVWTPGTASQPDLPLNKALRRDWSAGTISSGRVIEYARGAETQGASGVESLVGDAHNAHRHLVGALGYPESAPEIEWIEIPDKNGRMIPHPIICPLRWFEKLVRYYPERFETVMRGPPGGVSGFWENMATNVIYTSNKDRIDTNYSIPCTMHGDGAPTNKVDSLFTVSWSSLLGKGDTKSTRHVFTVLQKSMMGDATLDTVFRRLAWSFNALACGQLPQRDWNGHRVADGGRKLASGWRLAMIGLRGDWEFFTQACGFPSSVSVPCMCFMCKASPRPVPLVWTNGGADAPWRRTLCTHESYIADLHRDGRRPASIFAIRTLRLEGVLADVMHTMDLGVTSHVCGNIMHEVMETAGWGSTQAARATKLNDHLQAYYKATKEKHRVDGRVTYGRVKRSGDWPKFLGKAASTRRLVHYALKLAIDFDSGSEHDKLRRGAAEAIVRIYEIFTSEPMFMSPAARSELARLSVAFMGIYSKLATSAMTQHRRAWKMSPKFHLMQHILEHQSWMNPRFSWAYADEDLQRILKEVATSCHAMNTPHMVLYKWAINTFDK
jgi:hypothetical protein